MKGEVEVRFVCEGCGTTLLVSKHNRPFDVMSNLEATVTVEHVLCPTCEGDASATVATPHSVSKKELMRRINDLERRIAMLEVEKLDVSYALLARRP